MVRIIVKTIRRIMMYDSGDHHCEDYKYHDKDHSGNHQYYELAGF